MILDDLIVKLGAIRAANSGNLEVRIETYGHGSGYLSEIDEPKIDRLHPGIVIISKGGSGEDIKL